MKAGKGFSPGCLLQLKDIPRPTGIDNKISWDEKAVYVILEEIECPVMLLDGKCGYLHFIMLLTPGAVPVILKRFLVENCWEILS